MLRVRARVEVGMHNSTRDYEGRKLAPNVFRDRHDGVNGTYSSGRWRDVPQCNPQSTVSYNRDRAGDFTNSSILCNFGRRKKMQSKMKWAYLCKLSVQVSEEGKATYRQNELGMNTCGKAIKAQGRILEMIVCIRGRVAAKLAECH